MQEAAGRRAELPFKVLPDLHPPALVQVTTQSCEIHTARVNKQLKKYLDLYLEILEKQKGREKKKKRLRILKQFRFISIAGIMFLVTTTIAGLLLHK